MVTGYVNDIKFIGPDSWRVCSTGIFQRILRDWEPDKPIAARDRVKLFGILTGTEYKAVSESKDEVLEAAIWQVTSFVYYEPMDFDALLRPKTLTVNGRTVEIPDRMGRMSIGQNIHVRQAIMSGVNPAALVSLATAVYLQPLLDAAVVNGKEVPAEFNYERAQEIEKHILEMPVTEIYPIGFFFSRQLTPSGSTQWNSLRLKILRKVQNVRRSLSWPTQLSSTPTLKKAS